MNYIKKYQKGSKLNKIIYNSIDPTSDYPNLLDAVGHTANLTLGIFGRKIKKENEPVSDAAWRKRLEMDYDKNLLLDNPDGSVRLPPNYERQILADTLGVKKRIQDAIDIYGSEEELKKYDADRENWLRIDRNYLDKLRKMYKGEPIVVNEFEAWRDRKTDDNAISPLNVMKNFTLKYNPKTKQISYEDVYDFNEFEKLVPGKSFNISGIVPKKQKGNKIMKNKEKSISSIIEKYTIDENINFPNLLPEATAVGKDLRKLPKPKPKYDKSYLDWFLREPINQGEIAKVDSLNKTNVVFNHQDGGKVVPNFEAIYKGVRDYKNFNRTLDSTLNAELKKRWLSGERNVGVKWVGQAPINPMDTMSNTTLSGFHNFLNQKLDSVISNSPARIIERKETVNKFKPLKESFKSKIQPGWTE